VALEKKRLDNKRIKQAQDQNENRKAFENNLKS
jgi:hypothetical protein